MVKYQRFIKNVGLMGIAQFILNIQVFLLIPIMTKFLGAYNYGIWSQIKITILLLSGLAMFGFNASILRFISGRKDKKKVSKEFISILSLCGLSALILSLLIFLFSNKLSLILTHSLQAGIFFKLAAILIFFNVLYSLFLYFLRAKENIKIFSLIELIRAVLEISLIYILLLKGYDILGIIIAYIVTKIIVILFSITQTKKYFKLQKPSFKIIKPYLFFGLPLMFLPFLNILIQGGDKYVIGYFLGAKQVGIYALAYSLTWILQEVFRPINMVLLPKLSSAINNNQIKESKIYFNYSYKYTFLLLIPSLFGLSLLANYIIPLIATSEFIGASKLIPILGAGMLFSVIWTFATIILQLQGKTKNILIILLSLTLLNFLLNILLVPFLQINGAAISTLITFVISGIIAMRIIHKAGMDLMPKFIGKSVIASLIMGIVIWYLKFLNINVILKIIVIIILGGLVYLISMFLLKGIQMQELVKIIRLGIKRKGLKNENP